MTEGRSHLKNEVIFHANKLVIGPAGQRTKEGSIDLNHKGVMLSRKEFLGGRLKDGALQTQAGQKSCLLSYIHF